MSVVYFQDRLCDIDEVRINPANRAFKFSDGCFEAVKVYKGKPLFWNFHYARLKEALDVLTIRSTFDNEQLKSIVTELIDANSKIESGMLRVMVYRSGGGKYIPESNDSEMYIEYSATSYHVYPHPVIEKRAILYDEIRLPKHFLGNHKMLNKSIHVQAGIFAERHGYNEALLVNQEGTIAEAISSSLFILKDDHIQTPPLSAGGLNGTIRKAMFQLSENLSTPIIEMEIYPEALDDAMEIWTTNASTGISAVSFYKNRTYGTEMANQVQKKLIESAINSAQDFLEIQP
jgi:branched-chain amino acid aminotransferase